MKITKVLYNCLCHCCNGKQRDMSISNNTLSAYNSLYLAVLEEFLDLLDKGSVKRLKVILNG